MDDIASFGYWVRRRRKALDLTQVALAQRLGCAEVTIRKIEQDERRPSREIADLLADNLAIPAAERDSFVRMARGEFVAAMASPLEDVSPLTFLGGREKLTDTQKSVFVAREHELAQLDGFLALALSDQPALGQPVARPGFAIRAGGPAGCVVFVTGEAGSGKTALVGEFSRRAQEAVADLIVAGGNCNAYIGVGDPYLPFREVLGLLTGDVEARWAAGAMGWEQARRLWGLMPHTVQALVKSGPDLIDTFVPGTALLNRAVVAAPGGPGWRTQLEELVARQAATQSRANLQQSDLFEQYTRVLRALAGYAPLVLILDDLQWADAGSINLLFHLGRRLEGVRLLIVGIYRPADVALGRDGERHPLESVVGEFRRYFGHNQVDLSQTDDKRFVEAFLDAEPNRLGTSFREALYQHARGHPLFTVETLRGMQERGDLVQDEDGLWTEGPTLDWETLPARVEGVIGERINRLPARLQEVLKVASVEGEFFTAEVLARSQAADEPAMVHRLSSELDRQHRLVESQSSQRMGSTGQRLSQYRFRHILFQRYLYTSLDDVERAYLHETVGTVLEELYQGQTGEVAGQLARHFEAAGLTEKAIGYLRQAGERAVRLSAHEDAVALFIRALRLLDTFPDPSQHSQQELDLQIALGYALIVLKGSAAPEVGRAFARARELSYQLEETPQLFHLLWGLWTFWLVRGEIQSTARELAEQCLQMAQRLRDPTLLLGAYQALGTTSLMGGDLVPAQAHLEQMITLYDPQQSDALVSLYGQDLGVFCLRYIGWVKWLLGYPEQALAQSDQALTLAQRIAHPFSLAGALAFDIFIQYSCREEQAVEERAEECITLSTKHGFALWKLKGMMFRGWTLTQRGRLEEGVEQMRQGLADYYATGARSLVLLPLLLIEAHLRMGQVAEGLAELEKTFSAIEKTGEGTIEAELFRLKGELLRMGGVNEGEVEACFHQAIKIARRQSAKSWELRATMSLCRLWQAQGRKEEARQMLADIYDWFTEGFDTADLKEAKALLQTLT
jgi:predicted ATPase/transcriptional regulator with XRE-family HTH domain